MENEHTIMTDIKARQFGIKDDHWLSVINADGGLKTMIDTDLLENWMGVHVDGTNTDVNVEIHIDDNDTIFASMWAYSVFERNGKLETDCNDLLGCAVITWHPKNEQDYKNAVDKLKS